MSFGEYIKNLRNENSLSQRDLAKKSSLSDSEISRIETGERKKTSPISLKAIAPFLGVSYQELMIRAGFSEKTIDHQSYTEYIYRDDDGKLMDIVRISKDSSETDNKWLSLANRISSSELSEKELDALRLQTEALFEHLLQNKKNSK